jgi:HK97 family phage major capsid protein
MDLRNNPYAARTAARVMRSLVIGKGMPDVAIAYAQGKNWNDAAHVADHIKSAVTQMGTSDLLPATIAAAEFSAAVRPLTVIGRLQGVRHVPLFLRILTALNGASARFVGEGKPVPVSAPDLAGETLLPKKCSGITIQTLELATSSKPVSENLLGDDLASACAQAIDQAFLDPANAGDAETPASITSGITALNSTGATLANVDADLRAMLDQLIYAGSTMQLAQWIMRPLTAAYLSGLRGTGGDLAYPTISVLGGTLLGLPVIVSGSFPDAGSPPVGTIVLVDGSQVCLGDENQAELAISTAAAFQLSDAPTNDASGATATTTVSMFQTHSVALRGSRYLNWSLRRPFVSVLAGVTY